MTEPGSVRVLGLSPDASTLDRAFRDGFSIGRGEGCDVRVDSPLASRRHAEVYRAGGEWRIRDLSSTNGLYVDGHRTDDAPLRDGAVVRIGRDGPELQIGLVLQEPPQPPAPVAEMETAPPGGATVEHEAAASRASPAEPASSASPEPSLSRVMERYFDEDSQHPAGDHTRLIRQAYRTVRQKHTRKWRRWLAGLGALLLLTLGLAAYQRVQNEQLRLQAREIFTSLKELDVTIVNLRRLVERQGGAELTEQLARLDGQRARLSAQYEGYVRDMGVYRKLRSEEERLIYRTARTFGESETTLTREFVQAVKSEIAEYWQTRGRERFRRAIARADESEYTPFIVQTLQENGLPPEFFYLALQESDFIPDRVGPPTRWGHAKGAWQFIPSTARRYGLNPGLKADTDAKDPLDERQNFFLATDAAARYLLDLHGVLTQASGLLVMASYNWGEHRVLPRLSGLSTPDAVFDATFEDVPADPEWRNYWRFLTEYGDRMPEETKDYVLKIFSAAVVGSNPRYFGFDFDDPLGPYVDR